MHSITLTEVIAGDGGGGSSAGDSDDTSSSVSSTYSFASDGLCTVEIAGDSLHEHASRMDGPLIVREWDNRAAIWHRLHLREHQAARDRFVDDVGIGHSLRGKIVQVSVKRRKKKQNLVTCLHRKGTSVCPVLVWVDNVPVMLRDYDPRRDSFGASILGANHGRLKCTSLQLYPYTNVKLMDVDNFCKTGMLHLQRVLRNS